MSNLVHQPFEFDYSKVDLRSLGLDASLLEALKDFTEEELLLLRWRMTWKRIARVKQLPPPEFENFEKMIWGIRSGRGFGKTLSAGNWIGVQAALFKSHYAVVAPTSDDTRYTCFEGPTGLLSVVPPKLIVDYTKTPPILTLWNGSILRGFAGDSPERLRGPQHAKAWCDEIASWLYPQDAWDNLLFGLRLGSAPQIVWTGTPKPTPFVRKLQADPNGVVVVGSTYENKENLTKFFYDNIRKYEGTKIGRQELHGEVLDPEEEGYIRRSQWRMWPHDKPLPTFQYIIMSLDTAFTEKTHDKKEQKSDPTACSVWGLFSRSNPTTKKVEKNVLLLDCWEDWLGLPALIKRVKQERQLTYGDQDEPLIKPLVIPNHLRARHQGRSIDLILIEDKGSGISLRQSLSAENILTEAFNPGKSDKLTRLHIVSPLWANKRVWAVESSVNPGNFKDWAEPLISQICSYTGEGSTERDDLLDTTTQALQLLMNKFFGPFTVEEDIYEQNRRGINEDERKRVRKRNPYS